MPQFNFYATLLDSFQNYLDCSENYRKFWGNSDTPSISEDEYKAKSYQELIDRINRVPFESEAADKGTAFNEVVDCLIANKESDKMTISSNLETGLITVQYKNHTFYFPIKVCNEFADYYKGARSQVFCKAPIITRRGIVSLYGYIDELMPKKIHDIKTTANYEEGKFRKHWQHRVYPYCIEKQTGFKVDGFEYNVLQMTNDEFNMFNECYNYNSASVEGELLDICERFIEFLEANKEKITDKRIFNYGK